MEKIREETGEDTGKNDLKESSLQIDQDMIMNKVRVLHISKYYHPFSGGTELVARQCVRALQGSDSLSRQDAVSCHDNSFEQGADDARHIHFEQVVFCFDHKGMKGSSSGERSGDSVDTVDGIRVVRCACEAKVASQSLSYSYRRRLLAVLRQFKPDIVVLHYPNPFASHYLLQFLEPNQRLVIFWHLDIVKQRVLGRLFSGQNIRLLERADKVIAASPNYADGSQWLGKYREKCVIIPDCIDDSRLAEADNSDLADLEAAIREKYAGRILCLAVGRHVEYKGFRYLIDAAEYLDGRFAIVITGTGPLTEELKRQAEHIKRCFDERKCQRNTSDDHCTDDYAGGCPEIVFVGLVSDDELRAYLNACDIFCFPSITKNEAFGIALAEAMYCGKPAVTFTIEGSGVNYVSLGGVTGIECRNRDCHAYAEAIRFLADHPEKRMKYGKAAKERVEDLFLYKQFSVNIQKLFGDLADSL